MLWRAQDCEAAVGTSILPVTKSCLCQGVFKVSQGDLELLPQVAFVPWFGSRLHCEQHCPSSVQFPRVVDKHDAWDVSTAR